MVGIVSLVFAELVEHYRPGWERGHEKEKWDAWEDWQEVARDMGHTTDIVKVYRRKTKPPRKKHRH